MDTQPEQLRADARRNREQIVAAARVLFVTHGVDTPMDEVARRAGVGIGTLYRRFPDREALIQAVAVDIVERLAAMAEAALTEEPTAWAALSRFVRHWAEIRMGMLQAALCPRMADALQVNSQLREARDRWLGLLEEMVRGAKAEGTMRQDVGAGDIAVFMSTVIGQQPALPPLFDAVPNRLVELVLDGLRGSARSPLPGVQLSVADLDA